MKFLRLGIEIFLIEIFFLFLIVFFWVLLVFLVGLFRNVIEKRYEMLFYKNNKIVYMNKLVEEVMNNYDENMIYNYLCVGCF